MTDPTTSDESAPAVPEPTPPYDIILPRAPLDERGRKIQRLAGRGQDLKITVDLRSHPNRKVWDGHSTTTWHDSLPEPIWVIYLRRRSQSWFYEMIGWDDVRVKDHDLDAAIDAALAKTEPARVWLDDRVYEHLSYKRDFAHMAGRIGGDNTGHSGRTGT